MEHLFQCTPSEHNQILLSDICRDIEKIRDGIAEKVSHFLVLIMGFVICVIMSFIYGWKLSLIVIPYVPIVLITNMIIAKVSYYLLNLMIW